MQIKKEALNGLLLLSYQDSNLDKQNQNLMCYHYTIGQSIFTLADRFTSVALRRKRVQKYIFFAMWQNLFYISLI